jgi:hypothetical protein
MLFSEYDAHNLHNDSTGQQLLKNKISRSSLKDIREPIEIWIHCIDIHSATAMSVLRRGKNSLPAGIMVWKMLLNLLFTIKFMLENGESDEVFPPLFTSYTCCWYRQAL